MYEDYYINIEKYLYLFLDNISFKEPSQYILQKDLNEKLEDYFYIKEKSGSRYLTVMDNYPEINFTNKLNDTNKALWKIIPFIKNDNLLYYVKNKFYDKYLEKEESPIKGFFTLNEEEILSERNEFKFIKLYSENKFQNYSELL